MCWPKSYQTPCLQSVSFLEMELCGLLHQLLALSSASILPLSFNIQLIFFLLQFLSYFPCLLLLPPLPHSPAHWHFCSVSSPPPHICSQHSKVHRLLHLCWNCFCWNELNIEYWRIYSIMPWFHFEKTQPGHLELQNPERHLDEKTFGTITNL